MKEFFSAALPWIIMGLCIAFLAVHISDKKEKKSEKGNYFDEGMCFGMSLGTLLSLLGVVDLSMGISLGMLIGMTIGSFIEKNDKAGRGN
jgi:hypothetical protein